MQWRPDFAFVALTVAAIEPVYAQPPSAPKGIWEPLNYSEDIDLNDVFFVTPEIGFVAGAAGTILKTTDAGATWTALLGGDPLSEERGIHQLWFLSPTVGWATQVTSSQTNLLRTTDGDFWETIGIIPEHYQDIAFAGETDGLYIDSGPKLFRTRDSGKTWTEVAQCSTRAVLAGLTRQVDCNFWKLRYATPTVVYALADALGDVDAAIIFKSVDAGASWSAVAVVEGHMANEGGLFFVDENTGYFSTTYSKAAFRTTDGGVTWTGMPATSIHRRIVFADPEVGWTMMYNQLSFTTDGGRRWASRTIDFPAQPRAFSMPRRDVAYAVGEHGMIYRYRIVPPGTPVAAGSIETVAMPPLANEVIEQVAELEAGLDGIQAAIFAAEATPAGTGEVTAPAGEAAPPADVGWVEANYEEFGTFETTLDTVATGLPAVGSKHRNLNLLLGGLQLLSELTGRGGGLKQTFASLRQARDAQSVAAALLSLRSELEAAKTSLEAFETFRPTEQ
jgi:photosystem II stability/assembly factor-like uncharacterized protein